MGKISNGSRMYEYIAPNDDDELKSCNNNNIKLFFYNDIVYIQLLT